MKKIIIHLLFVSVITLSLADELEQAWIYFLNEKYSVSERIVDSCLSEGLAAPEVYYLKALLLLKRARLEDARNYFEELSFYGGKWSEYALAGEADSFFLEGDFKKANLLYSAFLKRMPNSNLVPEVIYKYALCLRKQGDWSEAKFNFQMLIKTYPDSLPASFARKILEENDFFFTIQIGSFLNYDNAYSLAEKVSDLGYNTYIKKVEYKGNLYYRVRVGKFQTRNEVEETYKKLLVQGFNGIVYP